MELIKINYQGDRQTISARALWEFLEVGTHFKDWLPRMCEYGFVEGNDFRPILSESTGGRPSTDYEITIDMAKELAMLQRTEKGKQARQYFIEVEKKHRQQSINTSELSPQTQLLLQLSQSIAKAELEAKEIRQVVLETKTGLDEAKEKINAIQDTLANLPKDQWREWVSKSMNDTVKVKGFKHDEIRNESYRLLEQRAGADLSTRVRNARTRLENMGAKKTEVDRFCKLDAVEEDKRLKAIYTSIIKEIRIKYLV